MSFSQQLTGFNKIPHSIRNGLALLFTGHAALVWKEIRKRMYSTSLSFGLRRDLRAVFQSPKAKIKIAIRPIEQGDFNILMEDGAMKDLYPKFYREQKKLADENIPTGYVAVTDEGVPCYMQWLIGPQQNVRIQRLFRGVFPNLSDDEALLEGAFTSRAFRGNGVMPQAMSEIANEAKDLGVRRVITFVDIENIPSLKGCYRAGFSPYILRKDQWLLFRRKITYKKVPVDLLIQYRNTITKRPSKSKVAS